MASNTASASPPETYTILMMGLDRRENEGIDQGVRPDALGVLRIDFQAGSCRLLSIPRNTLAPLPGYGQSKINHGYNFGGAELEKQAVSGFLGIEIDRYAALDMKGFKVLVDAVGGVTVQEPEVFEMAYGEGSNSYQSSPQTLSGPEALAYVRYRYGPDGDYGRVRRQQQMARSFLESTQDLDPATFLTEMVPALAQYSRTDLMLEEMVTLMTQAREICSAEHLETEVIHGTPAMAWDDGFQQELWVDLTDPMEVQQKAVWLMGED